MSILCVGQLVADIVVRSVDRLPAAGRADLVDQIEIIAGGCAANTASVLAKLGAPTTVGGLIGMDRFGDTIVADLNESGIRRNAQTRTTAVVVLVDNAGERSFLYREGGNEAFTSDMVDDSALALATIMHIGGVMKLTSLDTLDLLSRARRAGCSTSLDTDWDVHGSWSTRLAPLLPFVDYLMTNEEEGAMVTGQSEPECIGQALLKSGPKVVVVKCGATGSVLITRDGAQRYATHPVAVQDTTCAGDSFAGGFLMGCYEGWDLDRCMRLASAAGALCTTDISHRAIHNRHQVEKLYEL